jgi:predicted DNA-binding transcriptional regulator YafY
MRNISRPQYYRIKRILEMIREGTRTGRYCNASDFIRELEIARRTVIRDLDFLRDEENAPVEYDESRKGYYLSDPTWSLPPARLSRKELFAFSIARKLLERFHGTALDLDLRSVMNKIAESLEGTITVDLGALTEHFTVLGEDYVLQDPAIWKAVSQCVERHEAVEVRYQKFNGEEKTYLLEPYHLISYHGNWYVLGRERMASAFVSRLRRDNEDGGRKTEGRRQRAEARVRRTEGEEIRTFAVSRIRSVRGRGEFFVVPKSFDVKTHIERAFGIVRGEETMEVRLLFSKTVAAYIRERVWHPSQTMIDRKGGALELRLKTAGWKELVRWILSWQPDVKVLAPQALRDRVAVKLKQGLAAQGRQRSA